MIFDSQILRSHSPRRATATVLLLLILLASWPTPAAGCFSTGFPESEDWIGGGVRLSFEPDQEDLLVTVH